MENRTAKCCRLQNKKTPFYISKGSRPRSGLPNRVLAWAPLPGDERAALLPAPSQVTVTVTVSLRHDAPLGPAPQASAPSLPHISKPLPETLCSWSLDLRVGGLLPAILGSSDVPFCGGSGSTRASGWRNSPAQTSAVDARRFGTCLSPRCCCCGVRFSGANLVLRDN